MTMQASEKLFLQTVGRFVAERMKPLQLRIAQLETQVRELKEAGIRYCGTYQRAIDYKRGDLVSHDGSMWIVVADAAKALEIPGKSPSWQLCVKAGRDARDHRDAA